MFRISGTKSSINSILRIAVGMGSRSASSGSPVGASRHGILTMASYGLPENQWAALELGEDVKKLAVGAKAGGARSVQALFALPGEQVGE